MVNIPRNPGIQLIESQMIDACEVVRDNRGIYDDILNEATGELVKPANDVDSTIYSGKCLIATVDKGDKELPIAAMPKMLNGYKVLMPNNASTGNIRIGDQFIVTQASYDETLTHNEYRVSKIDSSTHHVYRRVMIEEIDDSIDTNNPAAS